MLQIVFKVAQTALLHIANLALVQQKQRSQTNPAEYAHPVGRQVPAIGSHWFF